MFFVITGGPSVGKTTIISLLRDRGYTVVDELATQIIKEGKILPWVDRQSFQQEVLRRQLASEKPYLHSDEPVFLDRGLFDGEAYYLCDGLPIPNIFSNLPIAHYALALICEELSFFDNNGVRFENLEFTRRITPVIAECYERRNIQVARLPALPPEERVQLVLHLVNKRLQELSISVPVPNLPSFALAT